MAVDRYAAAKALRFREDGRGDVIPALEDLLRRETEDRVALEAAGTAAALDSELGRERISELIWHNDDRPDLRMEAVFILTELGPNPFTREQLNRIARDPVFEGQEARQAAVWGLGKAGLKSYEDLLAFIDHADEDTALHAIAGFGADAPQAVIDRLVHDLVTGDPRRAPAASEALRIIGSEAVLHAVIAAAQAQHIIPGWVLATLGRLPPENVRQQVSGSRMQSTFATGPTCSMHERRSSAVQDRGKPVTNKRPGSSSITGEPAFWTLTATMSPGLRLSSSRVKSTESH